MTDPNSKQRNEDCEVNDPKGEEQSKEHIEEIIHRDEIEIVALEEIIDEKREEIRHLKEERHDEGHHHPEEIFVNTKSKKYCEKEISFREVVLLAYHDAIFNDLFTYTVEYIKGPEQNPKGSMTDNIKVYVKNKMEFDVERGDRS